MLHITSCRKLGPQKLSGIQLGQWHISDFVKGGKASTNAPLPKYATESGKLSRHFYRRPGRVCPVNCRPCRLLASSALNVIAWMSMTASI